MMEMFCRSSKTKSKFKHERQKYNHETKNVQIRWQSNQVCVNIWLCCLLCRPWVLYSNSCYKIKEIKILSHHRHTLIDYFKLQMNIRCAWYESRPKSCPWIITIDYVEDSLLYILVKDMIINKTPFDVSGIQLVKLSKQHHFNPKLHLERLHV